MYIKIIKFYFLVRNLTILFCILYSIFWAITHHHEIGNYFIFHFDNDVEKYFWLFVHKVINFLNGFCHFAFYSVYYAPTIGMWLYLAECLAHFFYLKLYFPFVILNIDPQFSVPLLVETVIQSIPILYESFLMYLYTYFKDITRDFRSAETWPEKIWSVCKMGFFVLWRIIFFVILITKGWYEYYIIDWYKELEYIVIFFYRFIKKVVKYLIGK